MLKDISDFTRLAAVKALGAMGPAAAPAVPSLLPLLQDDSDEVCAAVEAALKRIDPKARTGSPQ
jgi:HEAT repeat protein